MAEATVEHPLHEPYESYARQREATVFGMWVFLASEILLFGALFAAFAVYRYTQTGAFDAAVRHTNELLGAVNTVWMLTSSAAVAVGARALDQGRVRLAGATMWAALALGVLFLATKMLEYREDLHEHLWPGPGFALPQAGARTFFSLYWVMTGVHAVHVTIGLCLVGRLAVMSVTGKLARRPDSVEATSLYWGLIDVVWVLVFPCLYLVGR